MTEDGQSLRPAVTARRAARAVVVVDRAAIAPRAGLVAAAPVAGMLALGIAIGQPIAAVTLGAGALLSGIAWRGVGGGERPPVGTMIGAAVALTIATLTGTLTGRWPWIHLAVLALFCLQAGLVSALGRRGNVIGTQSVIAFVVFGRFPEPLGSALQLAGLVLGGAAVQIAFASVVARPAARRQQRETVAAAYRQLAALAADPGGSSVPAAGALDAAESRLAVPALFADPALAILSQLVDEGRRIRLELIALGGPEGRGARELDAERLSNRLAAINGQLLAAARLVQTALDAAAARRVGRPTRGAWRPTAALLSDLRRIRAAASLSSPAGRHALRLAVVVAGTELLVQRLALPRAYWAVVAAATVLRPEFNATFSRGAERVAGTFGGVVLASLIAFGLKPGGWAIVGIVAALAWITYTLFPASFAAGIAGLTAIVVFLLHAIAPSSATLALDRGIDTLIGGAIGLVAYALWPTWSGQTLGWRLADVVEAQRDYLARVLEDLTAGREPAPDQVRPLARRARVRYADAEAAVTIAQSEPRKGLDPHAAAATLAGLRRLVYAVHALRADAHADPEPVPELARLAAGLLDALTRLAARLRDVADPGELPPLRRLCRSLLEDAGERISGALAAGLDELIDATNTVSASVGMKLP